MEIHGGDYHYLVEPTEKVLALYENLGWRWKEANRDVDMGPFIKLAVFGQTDAPVFSDLYKATEEELMGKRKFWAHRPQEGESLHL